MAVDDRDTAVLLYFDADGALRSATRPSGGAFTDTGPPLGQKAGGPSVAFAPNGEAIATWLGLTDEGGPGLSETIQAAEMPRGGTFGPVHDLDRGHSTATGSTGFSYAAGPAIDAEGNVTVLYSFETYGLPDFLGGPGSHYEWCTATRDAGAPAVTSLSVPATATAGRPVSMSATAFDRWTTAGITWTFGDGTASATGGGASHAFAGAGRYVVTATATDAVGNATSRSATIEVAPAPAPKAKAALAGGSVRARWAVGSAASAVRSLSVASVRKGATVTVACTGGGRRGCPFARRTHRATKTGTVSLTKDFTIRHGRQAVRARLRAGAVVKVVVTAPGRRGRTYRAAVHKGRGPSVARGCLAVGSRTRATAC